MKIKKDLIFLRISFDKSVVADLNYFIFFKKNFFFCKNRPRF